MINMLMALAKKVDNTQEEKVNVSRDENFPRTAYFSNSHGWLWVTSQFSANKMVDKQTFGKHKSGHNKL